jgi:hypothetical protein
MNGRPLRAYVASILREDAKNYKDPAEFILRNSYFFKPEQLPDQESLQSLTASKRLCAVALTRLEDVHAHAWDVATLKSQISALVSVLQEACSITDGGAAEETSAASQRSWQSQLSSTLRQIIANGQHGPALAETMVILGRDTVLAKVRVYAEHCITTRTTGEEENFRRLLPQNRRHNLGS